MTRGLLERRLEVLLAPAMTMAAAVVMVVEKTKPKLLVHPRDGLGEFAPPIHRPLLRPGILQRR